MALPGGHLGGEPCGDQTPRGQGEGLQLDIGLRGGERSPRAAGTEPWTGRRRAGGRALAAAGERPGLQAYDRRPG